MFIDSELARSLLFKAMLEEIKAEFNYIKECIN